jgi:undecaprenyl-diphosphatase
MSLWEALWLGILQGITEFLPISSSGHLALLHSFFGVEEGALAYDVFLHVATLLAVLGYFWRDWLGLLKGGFSMLRERSLADPRGRMLLFVIVGTIPAALLGLLFGKQIEAFFYTGEGPGRVGVMFFLTGMVLLLAERLARHSRPMGSMHWRDSIIIGLAQAAALIPGVSRAGSTMIGGLFLGLKRADAARFSFLLAAPITAGAALVKVPELSNLAEYDAGVLSIGFVTSFGVAILCIHYLLKLLQHYTFLPFAYYLIAAGTVTLAAIGMWITSAALLVIGIGAAWYLRHVPPIIGEDETGDDSPKVELK